MCYNKHMILYTLKDPLTLEVKFVGTTRSSGKLFTEHPAKWGYTISNIPKTNWLKGLVAGGLRPIVRVEEVIAPSISADLRKKLFLRKIRNQTFNVTDRAKRISSAIKSKWLDSSYREAVKQGKDSYLAIIQNKNLEKLLTVPCLQE